VEDLPAGVDLSRKENDKGLFEEKRSSPAQQRDANGGQAPPILDGEQVGKVRQIQGSRLFAERGVTFWKFNIEIELGSQQQRIAYRINRGPAIGFWVPAAGENMNIMFHSCNGFSLAVDPNTFSGPDPLWRDVLNSHQTRPFHVMLGGGDQLYMDAATVQTTFFSEWAVERNPHHKNHTEFSEEMQDELEQFYLDRYSMWFSQGLFGMATSQIPMVNMWDDHDIIDGYGSYPHHTMQTPVMMGVGAVAYKYYMLFQHQTVPEETEAEEPSWILGAHPGPYINQLARSVFMSLGKNIQLLALDCRTERMRDEILCEDSWERIFDRLEKDIIHGETKHLIVVLGIPIAYPRLNFLENVLTSRVMDPLKLIGRTGALGGFVNKFDGGVEILDDLDDHWTAKHHKDERNWLIQELQHVAAHKSVRVTILGGDVHLCAVGQFFSNKKLNIPKDRDHRYMPNIISSAIVNTPPSDLLADVLSRRNKVHHLDVFTDEDMVPMFFNDVDGKTRNNKRLLPRRNWCSIRDYIPKDTPAHSPSEGTVTPPHHDQPPTPYSMHTDDSEPTRPGTAGSLRRSLSQTRRAITSRLTGRGKAPPVAYYTRGGDRPGAHQRSTSADAVLRSSGQPLESEGSYFPAPNASDPNQQHRSFSSEGVPRQRAGSIDAPTRPNPFVRRPTDLSEKQLKADPQRGGHINLEWGLDVRLNVENVRGEPEGTTTDYRLIVPALEFQEEIPELPDPHRLRPKGGIRGLFGGYKRPPLLGDSVRGDSASISGSERGFRPASKAAAAAAGTTAGVERSPTPLGGWADGHKNAAAADDDDDDHRHYDDTLTPPLSTAPLAAASSGSVQRKPVPATTTSGGAPPDGQHLSVPPSTSVHSSRVRSSARAAPTSVPADDGRPPRKQYRARGLYGDLEDSGADSPLDETPGSGGGGGGAPPLVQYPPASQHQHQHQQWRQQPQEEPERGRGRWSMSGARRRDEYEEDDWAEPGSPTRYQREQNKGKRRSSWKFWKVGY
jgi:hypothetical protein